MSGIFAQDEWYWLPCAAETKKIKVPIVLAILCRGFLHKTCGTGCRARLREKNSKSRLYWLYCVVDFCTRRVVLAAVRGWEEKKSKSRLYWLAYVGDFCPRRVGGWYWLPCLWEEKIQSPDCAGWLAGWLATTMSNIKAICHVMV
jgi:hypothetical protein